MNYISESIRVLSILFEGLENPGSLYNQVNIDEYINRIKKECNTFIDIITHQDQKIKQQYLEIQTLKAELDMINTTVLGRLNNDITHMRHSVSQLAQPKQPKYVEELT